VAASNLGISAKHVGVQFDRKMFRNVIVFLIFVTINSIVADEDLCLAPICIVKTPCSFRLPSCARESLLTGGEQWIRIKGNRVDVTPTEEGSLDLEEFLTRDSCPLQIIVRNEIDAAVIVGCDYEKSNASLVTFLRPELGVKVTVANTERSNPWEYFNRPENSVDSSSTWIKNHETMEAELERSRQITDMLKSSNSLSNFHVEFKESEDPDYEFTSFTASQRSFIHKLALAMTVVASVLAIRRCLRQKKSTENTPKYHEFV